MEYISISDLFAAKGAKEKFLKFLNDGVGDYKVKMSQIEEMIENESSEDFIGFLDPIYIASWSAMNHGNSGEIELYHYDGLFFKGDDDGSYCYFGPYGSASDACNEIGGTWHQLCYWPDVGSAQIIVYKSEVTEAGRKLISDREADEIFDTISDLPGAMVHINGKANELVWFNVEPDRLFNDTFHDEIGKSIAGIYQDTSKLDVTKTEHFEALKLLLVKAGYECQKVNPDVLNLGNVDVSAILRLDFGRRKSLNKYVGKWVRICPDVDYLSNHLAYIKEIGMPDGLIKSLVPVGRS